MTRRSPLLPTLVVALAVTLVLPGCTDGDPGGGGEPVGTVDAVGAAGGAPDEEAAGATRPEDAGPAAAAEPAEDRFDIADLPVSTAPLGDHPYFSVPDGYREDPLDTVRMEFASAAFWTGDRFETVEGPVYATGIRRSSRSGPAFSALQVARDLEQAILAAGGVMVFDGTTPPEMRDDPATKAVMDPYDTEAKCWGHDPFRVFVIRREDREIWIRNCLSGKFSGLIVAETRELVPTVKLLEADTLKQQLDADGRVAVQVSFATDSAEILPESKPQIDQVLELLREYPELRLSVDGHTDNSGGARHNQALSERRAAAVTAALADQGIGASRLQSRGFGQDRPVEDNATEAGRAANRRVELVRL